MALNIKNKEVERLAAEVADMTGESKTEAIRQALDERRRRLRLRIPDDVRRERLVGFLERCRPIWSGAPPPTPRARRSSVTGRRARDPRLVGPHGRGLP